jgi:hypothetical protein
VSWETPAPTPPAGPTVGWEPPGTTNGFGVMEQIRGGWRTYRAASAALVRIALVPQAVQAILLIPVVLLSVAMIEGMIRVFGELDFDAYGADPVAYQQYIQTAIETAVRPPPALAFWSGVVSGASLTLGLFGASLLTAGALAVFDGRRPSVLGSVRAVAARGDGIVAPAIVVGMAWAVIGTSLEMRQTDAAFNSSGGSAAIGGLLGIASFAIIVVAFVLAVRWSLAIPAILAEGLGLRAGLARSAALTAGIRIQIGLALFVAGLIFGFLGGLVALVGGLIGFGLGGTIQAGVVGYFVTVAVAALLLAPIIPAMLARNYRFRTAPAPEVASTAAAA